MTQGDQASYGYIKMLLKVIKTTIWSLKLENEIRWEEVGTWTVSIFSWFVVLNRYLLKMTTSGLNVVLAWPPRKHNFKQRLMGYHLLRISIPRSRSEGQREWHREEGKPIGFIIKLVATKCKQFFHLMQQHSGKPYKLCVMSWIISPSPKFICWSPNPNYMIIWLHLEIESLKR